MESGERVDELWRRVEEGQYLEPLYMPDWGINNGRMASLKVIRTKIIN